MGARIAPSAAAAYCILWRLDQVVRYGLLVLSLGWIALKAVFRAPP
jgi:hypothetical protein